MIWRTSVSVEAATLADAYSRLTRDVDKTKPSWLRRDFQGTRSSFPPSRRHRSALRFAARQDCKPDLRAQAPHRSTAALRATPLRNPCNCVPRKSPNWCRGLAGEECLIDQLRAFFSRRPGSKLAISEERNCRDCRKGVARNAAVERCGACALRSGLQSWRAAKRRADRCRRDGGNDDLVPGNPCATRKAFVLSTSRVNLE